MLAVHKEGATGLSYLTTSHWPRADGFCFLIDRHCWEDGLDETYPWGWSVTGLEARLLRQGRSVIAVKHYDDVIVHYKGKSGDAYKKVASGGARKETVAGWFEGRHVTVVDRLPPR